MRHYKKFSNDYKRYAWAVIREDTFENLNCLFEIINAISVGHKKIEESIVVYLYFKNMSNSVFIPKKNHKKNDTLFDSL